MGAQFEEMQQGGGLRNFRTMATFRKRLISMSKEELVSALEEIATLDLSAQTRLSLEFTLISQLAAKDPEYTLTKYFDRLNDDNFSWQLSQAMQELAKKDPRAAMAWLDRQIKDGKFESKSLDGRSQPRIQFEGGLIALLISSDPQAAGDRLAALPENQREAAISNFHPALSEADQLTFAQIVREQIPEKDQARTLGSQASRLVSNGDYASATEFFDRIQATPTERSGSVEQIAQSKIQSSRKKITREDLDTMRDWVTSQAPEMTAKVTGSVLASASGNDRSINYTQAAALALEYYEESKNDDVLTSFLSSWQARNHKEQARILAAHISDEKQRKAILKNLE